MTCLQSIAPVCSKTWSLVTLVKCAAALHWYPHLNYPELNPQYFVPSISLTDAGEKWGKRFLRIPYVEFKS